jgi:protein-tyrosine phosphatase
MPTDLDLRRTRVEVARGRWLGGDLTPMPSDVSVIITLETTTPPLHLAGVTELRFPFRDSRWEQVPRRVVDSAVAAVVAVECPVLVRCRHGLNRSALVMCLALMRGGVTAENAVARVRAARPGALTNPYFVDLIRSYPQEPTRSSSMALGVGADLGFRQPSR